MVVDPADQFETPYLYCNNDPVKIVDPDGQFSFDFVTSMWNDVKENLSSWFSKSSKIELIKETVQTTAEDIEQSYIGLQFKSTVHESHDLMMNPWTTRSMTMSGFLIPELWVGATIVNFYQASVSTYSIVHAEQRTVQDVSNLSYQYIGTFVGIRSPLGGQLIQELQYLPKTGNRNIWITGLENVPINEMEKENIILHKGP
jgi:hypothetical protein